MYKKLDQCGIPELIRTAQTYRNWETERFRDVFTTWLVQLLAESGDTTDSEDVQPIFSGECILTTEAYTLLMQDGVTHTSDVILLNGDTSVFTNHTLWEAVRFFEQLEPFGHGFPKPMFSMVVSMKNVPRVFFMGADKQHAKLMLSNGLFVIYWNGASMFMPRDTENHELDERLFLLLQERSESMSIMGTESLQLIASNVREWT